MMMMMMKSTIFLFSFLCLVLNTYSQDLWQQIDVKNLSEEALVKRNNFPNEAFYYSLKLDALKAKLVNAPERGQSTINDLIISFPTANGTMENFKVLSSPIMHPDLSAKYPMIKTYVAQGIDDPTAYMRFSVTQFGLHTMCLSGTKSANYIDPFTKDKKHYIVYDKKSLGQDSQPFECLMDGGNISASKTVGHTDIQAIDDQKFRKYRLALSCNAQYGNIFGINAGTEKADIQAQMAISVNRVNTVYEIDFAIQLEFVANNDLVIYFGATGSDPWNGTNQTTNASVLDNAIGVNNYDIGHHFNTTGGGNAGCLSCVCVSTSQNNTHKGRAYTGRANPTGDPFDIDYVAHEMGHQFGGYHTQSNQSCRSGSGQTEVEPGSGSSIMGYAGICNDNVQDNSDAHFNYVNIRDVSNDIKPGGSCDCGLELAISNAPPTANAGANYTIPKSTAFILEGVATDPNGMASLTYNWSQNDPENPSSNSAPSSTRTQGPMYRSIYPTVSPNRYLPEIAEVIAGNLTPTWEVTPSVGRTMEFAFMVRDNDIQGGQTADDLMTVTVEGSAGPFEVTSQTNTQNWETGEMHTVTWDVAGTNAGNVNAPNVDIFFSTDGGYTYPVVLLASTPNDGSQSILLPSSAITNTGKIMVRGSNNIFYALNDGNVIVTPGEFVIDFISTSLVSCNFNDVMYEFSYTPFGGFAETVNFSLTNLPAGVMATFNPTTASTTTNVQITLSNITAANNGLHDIVFNAISTSANQTDSLVLDVGNAPFAATLANPANNAVGVATNTSLDWNAFLGAGVEYDLEISTDPAFATTVETVNNLTTSSYISTVLAGNVTYYWRVRTSNLCGNSPFSNVFNFTTTSCLFMSSTDIPLNISNSGSPTITSILNFPISGIISDVDVINVNGDHTYVSDLTVSLTSPQGTTIILWDDICGGNNDFILNFDDASALTTINCPPTDNGVYQPEETLASFNGENPIGNWTLTVEDRFNNDGGSLDGWSLIICSTPPVCILPDVPIIAVSELEICEGELSNLSIASGNLNDAINWVWYQNSCTGASLGSGTSLNVTPSSTTTYYARGEGACVTNASCGTEVVNVFVDNVTTNVLTETDSAFVNGSWYFASQEIVAVLVSVAGCDSTIKTNLTINESEPEGPNAIANLSMSNSFTIYPNPSNGSFIFEVLEDLNLSNQNEIVVYNMLGKEVFRKENMSEQSLEINLENNAKGIYHIVFRNERISFMKDVVVY
jgi:subtilisin-like proprotein convertase family protein